MKEAAENRVIYVGETHTSLADHRLQLQVIEALHNKNQKLAIGLEMFPVASQSALDRFIDGDIDEKIFIKESRWYEVWRFDYRLYRDIFLLARERGIPLVALNLDRDIVSQVFQGGGTLALDDQTRAKIPRERDLSLPGYTEQLAASLQMHHVGGHASGSLGGFIEAQSLWDESMAANIVSYLKTNPNHRMVVLAGSQHTRKDHGIPPRVTRRLAVNQTVLEGINAASQTAGVAEQADFVFLLKEQWLPDSPKIGVVLDQSEEGLQILELSPHGKAQEVLREKDRILALDGFAVTDLADLKIALLDRKPGELVKLQIARPEFGGSKEMVVEVELSAPPQ
jgi:uncharacterized iron-regulated protein